MFGSKSLLGLSLKECNLEMKLDIQKDPYVSKVPGAN